MLTAPPDLGRTFGALADATRRDIVRRASDANEGVAELADHHPMSFAAVQKPAVLERAGLVTKERIGRRKVVRDVEGRAWLGACSTATKNLGKDGSTA
jgi:DNA-binding transcriptional ArsR family regulator